MPAFSFLPQLQRWQLVLHLRERAASRSAVASRPVARWYHAG
jgi:hypothetical protein